jgi:hypothetical protein
MTPPMPDGALQLSLHATLAGMRAATGRFFQGTCDARRYALLRVAYGILVLVYLLVLFPDFVVFYGERGVLPTAVARQVGERGAWSVFDCLPHDEQTLQTCYWIIVAQTVGLIVGLGARLQAACLFVWWLSLHNRNALILDAEDTLFRLLAFYLTLMPIGQRWSIDAWLWKRPGKTRQATRAPLWPLRLLQIQMALVFWSAGLSKINGAAWLNGTALYYVARLDDYFGRFPLPSFLFAKTWFVAFMTWTVIVTELFVPVFIWFRETRRWALLAVVALHLAMEYCMYLFLFNWIMLVGWLAFVEWDDFVVRSLRSMAGIEQST